MIVSSVYVKTDSNVSRRVPTATHVVTHAGLATDSLGSLVQETHTHVSVVTTAGDACRPAVKNLVWGNIQCFKGNH